MRVKMLRTERGTRNGVQVETFVIGQEYDFTTPGETALATALIGMKSAVEVGAVRQPQVPPQQNKQPQQVRR